MRARHTSLPLPLLPALCLAGAVVLTAARCGPRDDAAPLRPDPTSCPGLVLVPEAIDLGRLEPGETRRIEVGWRREGPGPLRVLDTVPGCGCAAVEALPAVLPAGASGRLVATVEAPRAAGPLRIHTQIVTNARMRDPARGRAVTVLTVDAWVHGRLRAWPKRLELDRRTPGRHVERPIELLAAPTLARSDLRIALHGLSGAVRLTEPVIRGRTGWTARVGIDVPPRPGPFEGLLRIEIDGEPPVEVEIAGEAVGPEAQAEPPPRAGASGS